MSPSNKPLPKPVLRRSRRRWQLVPDLFDPFLWWVQDSGVWFSVRAPSYAEAEAFVVGLYGPAIPTE